MGFRLSKIYTRTGDKGETGLGDGRRVPKDHPRIEAIGEVDTLNSQVGVLLAGLAAQRPSIRAERSDRGIGALSAPTV
jgi:cob(I)alamin adenosyltransferase